MSDNRFSKFARTTYQGEEHVLVPVRQLGMFNVSHARDAPIIDSRSRMGGPDDWQSIGFVDVQDVEPAPPGTQDNFPSNYAIIPPGGIDWAVSLQPTGDVFFLGVSIIAQQVQATVNLETGAWTMDDPVICFHAPVTATVIKASNTDIVTGAEDVGADVSILHLNNRYLLIHGISKENSLRISGKILPSTNFWTIVQVSPSILAMPSQGLDIKTILHVANNLIEPDEAAAIQKIRLEKMVKGE